jgi:hypothetical protein
LAALFDRELVTLPDSRRELVIESRSMRHHEDSLEIISRRRQLMFRLFLQSLVLVGLCLQVTDLFAHFLFIRIGDHAEGGRAAEVFFSERAEAGDPRFVPKIAHTKLWMQSQPGKFEPLTVAAASDRLRAVVPSKGAASVVGECEYGVLKRDVPFLLQYFPKAVAGDPQKLNGLSSRREIPFEIMAEFKEGAVTLTALRNGKPVPGIVFTTVDDDLVNEELTANKAGKATWKPDAAGHYCVYAKDVLAKKGSHGGEAYSEVRRFATLAFNWPLVRSGDDDAAVAMFEKAIAARAVWRKFPGFTAEIDGAVDGRVFSGTVKIDADGSVETEIDAESIQEWVDDQLGSIVLHRKASSGKRPKPVLRFADDYTSHPLGRLLTFVGGSFASSYRVKDDQIMVVNRNIGPQNFTITILDNDKTADGKFLPRTYVVQYWDSKTGRLNRSESFRNGWKRVGAFDLPESLLVTKASKGGLIVREFKLSKHKLLESK